MIRNVIESANLDIHNIENANIPLSVANANAGPSTSGACCMVRDSPCLEVERSAMRR